MDPPKEPSSDLPEMPVPEDAAWQTGLASRSRFKGVMGRFREKRAADLKAAEEKAIEQEAAKQTALSNPQTTSTTSNQLQSQPETTQEGGEPTRTRLETAGHAFDALNLDVGADDTSDDNAGELPTSSTGVFGMASQVASNFVGNILNLGRGHPSSEGNEQPDKAPKLQPDSTPKMSKSAIHNMYKDDTMYTDFEFVNPDGTELTEDEMAPIVPFWAGLRKGVPNKNTVLKHLWEWTQEPKNSYCVGAYTKYKRQCTRRAQQSEEEACDDCARTGNPCIVAGRRGGELKVLPQQDESAREEADLMEVDS
ncbi:uncharacterized protein LTR77_003333 [Saxophila tyrrhenica]|uniref:Uncharacterized protein n=1 Tax=Saxophila tyrrhenica TaxID=1690608 RepID=A0AAV9PH19_9PEZI|nr:hypothetical protein LTR77_003333 [Saxophila tyrrhenica]